jgi:hypothetical protein
MPIDAATALADLDRLIETIGTVQTEDAAQPSQTRQKPIDFGRFGRCLDDADMPSSNHSPLKGNGNSDFGRFGRRKSENDYTDTDLADSGDCEAPREGGEYARTRVYDENIVQIVQIVQSPFPDSDLGIGRCLDDGIAVVQNPPWLYSADPASPPGDVPPGRWRQFLMDARAFAGSQWAEQAAALGWTEDDLYGADDAAPFARRDKAGLLRLLNGNRLIAISEDAAVIETRNGARQTYRRRRR